MVARLARLLRRTLQARDEKTVALREEPLIHCSPNYLEARLDPDRFFRASRQHILNLDWVKDMNSRPNGNLVAHLAGATNVELSHRRSSTFRKELSL